MIADLATRLRTPLLDTPKTALYKARPLAAVAWLLSAGAGAEVVQGAQLPDGAQKVGENRYRSTEDFKGTLKYYLFAYPVNTWPRKAIVNQPGVRAVHISNPSGKNFAGLNIYEANEEVRIYIVPAGSGKPVKKAPEKRSR